jgi:hypothetical protein
LALHVGKTGASSVFRKSFQVLLVTVALAACGGGVESDATGSAQQDLQSCPTACSQACPGGSFCKADANGCMTCQAPAGDFCQEASDCQGGVPHYCPRCSNGSDGCAHWACVNSECTIATCN